MRLRDRLKSFPRLYWTVRSVRKAIGEVLPPKQLPGVPGRIHANDLMMPKRVVRHVPGYVKSGEQVASLIGDHLPNDFRGAGLDLGCGHGRVLRHLVAACPDVEWTAVDIDRSAVRFCRREFGVEGLVAPPRLEDLRLPRASYDIVWMGSLITHLDAEAEQQLWALMERVMPDGGLLAFSTLGPSATTALEEFVPGGSSHERAAAAELASHGRAYVPYPHYQRSAYGITLHTPEYLDERVRTVARSASRLAYLPQGWVGTQDLNVFRLGR